MKRLLLILILLIGVPFAIPASRSWILEKVDAPLAELSAKANFGEETEALLTKIKDTAASLTSGEESGVDKSDLRARRHNWTLADGSQLDAVLVAADMNRAQLRVVDTMGVGQVNLDMFSESDRQEIQSWVQSDGKKGVAGYPIPIKRHDWPRQWKKSGKAILEQTPGTNEWHSANFHIINQAGIGPEALESIIRICESVDGALSSLPIPLPVNWGRPTDEKRKIIIESQDDSDVMQHAAGYWDGRTGYVHIFAEQLVEPDYQLVVFNFDKPEKVQKYDTIVHEVTHQSTSALMYLGVPAWVPEGLAEYMAATQYAPANYQFTNTHVAFRYHINKLLLGDRIVKNRQMNLAYLEKLMNRDIGEWNHIAGTDSAAGRLQYDESLLLVDYFVHRDHPEGLHFRRYLESVLTGVPEPVARERHLLRGRSYKKLEYEMVKLWKPLGLTINFQERGSIAASDITIDWTAEDNQRAMATQKAMEEALR